MLGLAAGRRDQRPGEDQRDEQAAGAERDQRSRSGCEMFWSSRAANVRAALSETFDGERGDDPQALRRDPASEMCSCAVSVTAETSPPRGPRCRCAARSVTSRCSCSSSPRIDRVGRARERASRRRRPGRPGRRRLRASACALAASSPAVCAGSVGYRRRARAAPPARSARRACAGARRSRRRPRGAASPTPCGSRGTRSAAETSAIVATIATIVRRERARERLECLAGPHRLPHDQDVVHAAHEVAGHVAEEHVAPRLQSTRDRARRGAGSARASRRLRGCERFLVDRQPVAAHRQPGVRRADDDQLVARRAPRSGRAGSTSPACTIGRRGDGEVALGRRERST